MSDPLNGTNVLLCEYVKKSVKWVKVARRLERESESEVAQSCPTLCYPMDCSLSGFSVHGIFQALKSSHHKKQNVILNAK